MLVLGSVPQTDTPMGWYLQVERNVVARSSRIVTIPKIPNKLNVGGLKGKTTQYLKISQGQKQMTGPKDKTTKQSIIRPPFVGTRLPKQNFAFWAKGTRERQAPIAAQGGKALFASVVAQWGVGCFKDTSFGGQPKRNLPLLRGFLKTTHLVVRAHMGHSPTRVTQIPPTTPTA